MFVLVHMHEQTDFLPHLRMMFYVNIYIALNSDLRPNKKTFYHVSVNEILDNVLIE